jgi:hypothetical protein
MHSVDDLEAIWRAQFSEMQAAVAELKLLHQNSAQNESWSYQISQYIGDTTSTSAQDLDEVKYLLEGEDEIANHGRGLTNTTRNAPFSPAYDLDWLLEQCSVAAEKHSGLDAFMLYEQVLSVLRSNNSSMR